MKFMHSNQTWKLVLVQPGTSESNSVQLMLNCEQLRTATLLSEQHIASRRCAPPHSGWRRRLRSSERLFHSLTKHISCQRKKLSMKLRLLESCARQSPVSKMLRWSGGGTTGAARNRSIRRPCAYSRDCSGPEHTRLVNCRWNLPACL